MIGTTNMRYKVLGGALTALAAGALVAGPASAEVSEETAFVFNTLLFLIGGFLVMLMAAGFAMLEVGFVRTKHAAAICLKNIALYSIAGLMFYLVGYQVMYGSETPYFGSAGEINVSVREASVHESVPHVVGVPDVVSDHLPITAMFKK